MALRTEESSLRPQTQLIHS